MVIAMMSTAKLCVVLLWVAMVVSGQPEYMRETSHDQQSLYQTCTSFNYRTLPVDLKMEHSCLLMQQVQHELHMDREDRIRRYGELNIALSRLNKKLNYLLTEFEPNFIDPFETGDNRILYKALLDVSDGQGRNWKIVRTSFLKELQDNIEEVERKCREIPAYLPNVDFADIPQDCYELLERGVRRDGVYAIRLFSGKVIQVYCDMTTDGGGWTVFQRRIDGSVSFNRSWAEYKAGFGNVNTEFWVGLESLHLMVTNRNSTLRVDLMDWEKQRAHAVYQTFHIDTERRSNYTLTVHTYSGTAGDALSYHSNNSFSTYDRDNDRWEDACAVQSSAGWWFRDCSYASLNNKYYNMRKARNRRKTIIDGIMWYHWKENYSYSMKRVEMKTRPAYITP